MGTDTDIDWTANLLEQLTWHLIHHGAEIALLRDLYVHRRA